MTYEMEEFVKVFREALNKRINHIVKDEMTDTPLVNMIQSCRARVLMDIDAALSTTIDRITEKRKF